MKELTYYQMSQIASGRKEDSRPKTYEEARAKKSAIFIAGFLTACTACAGYSCLRIYYQY